MRTLYDELEISRVASAEVIRGAYKHLIQKWHPDKHQNNYSQAAERTNLINQAYAVLSDPIQRQEYDLWLAESEGRVQDEPRPAAEEERAEQTTVVQLSKTKLLLLLCASAAFVALGFWLFQLDAAEIESYRRFNSPILVPGIGLASIVLFGLALVVAIRKLFDSSPGLVLDACGLTDNSSAFSGGFIPWSEISGLEERQVQNKRILYVLLTDPDKYIASCGPVKRTALKAMQNMVPSPVAIVSSALVIGFDELVALIGGHLEAQRLQKGYHLSHSSSQEGKGICR